MVDGHHIFHPQMLTQLRNSGFFPQRLSVVDRVESGRSPSGAVIWTDSVRAGHSEIPSALSYVNTAERMTQSMNIVTSDRRAVLSGYYPNIAHDDKVRDDSDLDIDEEDRDVYRIVKIDHDTQQQLSRIYLEMVTP